jgi:hypothetical protein
VLKLPGNAMSYLSTRAFSSFLSLGFAVLYSRQLGLTNRGYIAVVFTFSLLIISITLGGTTLTLRKIGLKEISIIESKSFNFLILIEILVGLTLFIFCLRIYSRFKLEIPPSLILGAIIYFLCSATHYVILEMIISTQQLKTAGFAEVVTVLMQIVFYFLFWKLQLFSTSVSLLLAFASSYFFVSVYFFYRANLGKVIAFGFTNPNLFFSMSKHHHVFGIALSMIDRIDRVLVVILFSPVVISQYATMSGILSIFRFLPDALGKISLSGTRIHLRRSRFNILFSILLIVLSISTLIYLTRWFIALTLGGDWLLPITSFIFFCFYELSRGGFQVTANRLMKSGDQEVSHKSSMRLFFLVPTILLFSVPTFGLDGVPLALAFSYLVTLLAIKVKKIA